MALGRHKGKKSLSYNPPGLDRKNMMMKSWRCRQKLFYFCFMPFLAVNCFPPNDFQLSIKKASEETILVTAPSSNNKYSYLCDARSKLAFVILLVASMLLAVHPANVQCRRLACSACVDQLDSCFEGLGLADRPNIAEMAVRSAAKPAM